MVDWVGNAGVFGHALVGEVDFAVFVDGNVFEESVATDSVVDVGFAVFVEVDDFSVATAFVVEDTFVVPAVFVVADEFAFGVGREGCFTSTRKAEEDCGACFVHVGVGRAVHRSDAFERFEVVHHREHTFFHFAAVPGVDDYLFFRGEVEDNGSFGVEAEFFVVFNFSFRGVVDDEVGFEVFELLFGRTDEHVFNEVGLPSNFDDEANFEASSHVSATETVDYVEFFVGELFNGDVFEFVPGFGRNGLVVVFIFVGGPPNGIFAGSVFNDIFVFGGTSGVDTGHHVYGVKFSFLTFFIALEAGASFIFVKLLVRGVVNNLGSTGDTVLG